MSAITIGEILKQARKKIDIVDARILLQHTLGVRNEYIASHPEKALSSEQEHTFQTLAHNRQQGEPVAYLIGSREFYGITLKVTPSVLIPRPETELLVEEALTRISQNDFSSVLDLGTGSGAIAIAIAQHRPTAKITACDASNAALLVAEENIKTVETTKNFSTISHQTKHAFPIELIWSDWYSALHDRKFDLIVSNPPYISTTDHHLEEGDVRFEPHLALSSGIDGLSALRKIVFDAPNYLNANGWLLCEHGYDQSQKVSELFTAAGFTEIFSSLDLASIPRVTGGKLLAK